MRHSAGAWGLTALLVAVSIGAIVWSPSRVVDRQRAIPAYARVIYNDEDPGWFLSFFPSFGSGVGRAVPASALPDDAQDSPIPSLEHRFKVFENAPLCVANISSNGPGRNSWVAVSELGGCASFAMRWMLMMNRPEGVEPARPYAAWPIWKVEGPDVPAWARIRFCIADGLLICSISQDSRAIFKLLDVLDGRAASRADTRRD